MKTIKLNVSLLLYFCLAAAWAIDPDETISNTNERPTKRVAPRPIFNSWTVARQPQAKNKKNPTKCARKTRQPERSPEECLTNAGSLQDPLQKQSSDNQRLLEEVESSKQQLSTLIAVNQTLHRQIFQLKQQLKQQQSHPHDQSDDLQKIVDTVNNYLSQKRALENQSLIAINQALIAKNAALKERMQERERQDTHTGQKRSLDDEGSDPKRQEFTPTAHSPFTPMDVDGPTALDTDLSGSNFGQMPVDDPPALDTDLLGSNFGQMPVDDPPAPDTDFLGSNFGQMDDPWGRTSPLFFDDPLQNLLDPETSWPPSP